jgi:general secretion pathway protein D
MKPIISLLLLFILNISSFAKCDDEHLNISLPASISVSSLLLAVADECSLSIIYEDKEASKTSDSKTLSVVNFVDLPINRILDILLHNNNLHYTLENDILTISTIKTVTLKVDYIDTARHGNSNTDVTISGSSASGGGDGAAGGASAGGSGGGGAGQTGATITTEEDFDFWGDLSTDLKNILKRPEDKSTDTSEIVINKKSGLITLSGTYQQIERVNNYIDLLLASLRKQVVIDVQVLSIILDNSNRTGVDWSKFEVSANLGSLFNINPKIPLTVDGGSAAYVINNNGKFEMNAFYNFLRQYGDTKSLSNPKILAINNQPTMISVGDNINYLVKSAIATGAVTGGSVSESSTPQSLFVGVLLDITAQIDDFGYITLRINPSISEFKYSQDAVKQAGSRDLPPDTTTRRISSVIRVKDNESVILGGLISTTRGETENKVPYLGDIPYLGTLFKSTLVADQTTEIVFVIRPRIVEVDAMPSLKTLGFSEIAKERKRVEAIKADKTTRELND